MIRWTEFDIFNPKKIKSEKRGSVHYTFLPNQNNLLEFHTVIKDCNTCIFLAIKKSFISPHFSYLIMQELLLVNNPTVRASLNFQSLLGKKVSDLENERGNQPFFKAMDDMTK